MYYRILKHLSNQGVELDHNADNRDKFRLEDDDSGSKIAHWNVPGVAKPTLSSLPTASTSDAWAKTARNADKISEAAFDAATLDELKAMIKPYFQKRNLFEEE